jgi:hypothetical protein
MSDDRVTYEVCMIVPGKARNTQDIKKVLGGFTERSEAAEKAARLANLTGNPYMVRKVEPQIFRDSTIRPM